ncbi:putative oxidoreductase [Pseudooceanicola batsensis HTCC2597]|uniref:Putative oxidoreductase n=1 Tax=Pseudooceanicola batsensis (strain ATCC BAA-863 / DSM 15984 / KCTC 12145 / HTCC2597) TaxID=252305 RepID=A3TVB7_PSEBH|nr:FAD-binding oxidoreductase [Pseudooceanicola batsensis]EAQ04463.1 putative oxidoreductase [Pseudooceanicola batsensis HTCC2597]
MADLSGWGRYPRVEGRLLRPRGAAEVRAALAEGPVIARGNGRSYGDSAAQPAGTLDMRGMAHMLDFDGRTGVLTAEAGVMLEDVIATFLPRGWFPAVTPGTKLVTLGGMIAADVHGKNHRRDGSFGRHVDWVEVLGPDGVVRRASCSENSELFGRTLGGMGLTGVILRCAIRLMRVESGWIRQDMRVAPDLDAAMEIFETAESRYAVAWFDCLGQGADLGRSLVMLGDHADVADLPAARRAAPFVTPRRRRKRVPVDAPAIALNRHTLRAFNSLYFRVNARKAGPSLVDWDSYFYPLDAILDWNRIYGRRGFAQYQVVLPLEASRGGLAALLRTIATSGRGSFLAVLKRLGPQESAFSFPMEGYTLALDFPVDPAVLSLLDRLDDITLAHGGRHYLAKDSRLSREALRKADPRAAAFAAHRREAGLAGRFASAQSERLGL